MKKGAYETACPAEPQAPAEPQVLRWRLRELLSVQAELAKIKMRVYANDFPKNDGLATERYLLNRPIVR